MSLGTAVIPWETLPVAEPSDADPGDLAMSRYADGDDTAFGAVHRAVADRLRAFLTRMGRSPALADDLLQQGACRGPKLVGEHGVRRLDKELPDRADLFFHPLQVLSQPFLCHQQHQ